MVRHGEYLTIYANLETLNIKPGDKVKANQILGSIYADPDYENRRILHFEVRKETQKLNPQNWVK
jgi:septal ring factor EnvC (AmiA/AmiB activator)